MHTKNLLSIKCGMANLFCVQSWFSGLKAPILLTNVFSNSELTKDQWPNNGARSIYHGPAINAYIVWSLRKLIYSLINWLLKDNRLDRFSILTHEKFGVLSIVLNCIGLYIYDYEWSIWMIID